MTKDLQAPNKTHYYISVLMFLFINDLFIVKYLSRISATTTAMVCLFYTIVSLFVMHRRPTFGLKCSKVILAVSCFVLLSLVVSLHFIPVETLNVDRWEIIDLFWNSLEKGLYPYQEVTRGGNHIGAMPMYFVAYYPFYLVKEIALFLLLVTIATISVVYRRAGIKAAALTAALILVSPSFYWEVVTRSTIIVNSTIFFGFFLLLRNFFHYSIFKLCLLALLGGVIFSMRNTFAIPLVVWGMFALRNHPQQWYKTVSWTVLFVLCFALTFLPLLIHWGDIFWNSNPFIVQSGELMPMWLILSFIVIAAVLGSFCTSFTQMLWYAGLSLFLLILGYSLNFIFTVGFEASFWQNKVDISYYLFVYPFIIYEIVTYHKQVER